MSDTAALTIRLDSAQRDQLAALATEHERSVAYFVRLAIERFLREVAAEAGLAQS